MICGALEKSNCFSRAGTILKGGKKRGDSDDRREDCGKTWGTQLGTLFDTPRPPEDDRGLFQY